MASIRTAITPRGPSTTQSLLRPRTDHCRSVLRARQQLRNASQKTSSKGSQPAAKKKSRKTFKVYDLKDAEKFSLCDAMRYIRAFEVGNDPVSVKYEVHVKLRTLKNGQVVRNRVQLPVPVKTETKIAVVAPPGSKAATQAKAAGAHIVGEEEIFDAVKEGNIDFDRCICHTDSVQKLNAAKVARILGPRGMMPNAKAGTITSDVTGLIKSMVGGSEYREKDGVVRLAVGQLGFTPIQLSANVKFFMDKMKADLGELSDRISKQIHEVVLSSTHAPGFTLNGDFRSEGSVTPEQLSVRN